MSKREDIAIIQDIKEAIDRILHLIHHKWNMKISCKIIRHKMQ
jgi:hypothetical protein